MSYRRFALTILIFAFPGIASAAFYGGHEYEFTTVSQSWLAAEAEAFAWGGHLVTINDQAEQDWLTAAFPGQPYWIGYTDEDVEGKWVWTSGETPGYENWARDTAHSPAWYWEPNGGTSENYAAMNVHVAGAWGDYSATGPTWGIMERSIPEPGILLLLGTSLAGLAGYGLRRRKKA